MIDHRQSDGTKKLRRQAFDNDIARFRQSLDGNDGDAFASTGQIAPRLVAIAHRNRSENKTGNARLQPARYIKADRPKARNTDL